MSDWYRQDRERERRSRGGQAGWDRWFDREREQRITEAGDRSEPHGPFGPEWEDYRTDNRARPGLQDPRAASYRPDQGRSFERSGRGRMEDRYSARSWEEPSRPPVGYPGPGTRSPAYGGSDDPRDSALGAPEAVQRVTDGDETAPFSSFGRAGDHRGRGPKNYRRPDARICEDVNQRLSDDPWLDASEIEVAVSNGEVTLSGTVSRREDKRRAEDLAEQVSGVGHVQNNLRAQPSQSYEGARADHR